MTFLRSIFQELKVRLTSPSNLIQVVIGPRQVGKTTGIQQTLESLGRPYVFASADDPQLQTATWIRQHWDEARSRKASGEDVVLVIDEIQKIEEWSSYVKLLWDEDKRQKKHFSVILSGSSPLLLQSGLTESLHGRFELLTVPHWSFQEMKEAFHFSLDDYIYFGGYPGAAELRSSHQRWERYLKDSLIETTLSRDILLLTRIDKPALLRRVFYLACTFSGQILSYQKMLGQLQDKGNAATVAHYLDILGSIGLVGGIEKFDPNPHSRIKRSSPKLGVYNTALMTTLLGIEWHEFRSDPRRFGRIFESVVGAHLLNAAFAQNIKLGYWREGNDEVDYVIWKGSRVLAIEVKSGFEERPLAGLEAFSKKFPRAKTLLVGTGGLAIEKFLSTDPQEWIS